MREHSDIPDSLRHRVFKLLDKNPLLKPKQICELLKESYLERGEVVTQYKKQWKKEYKNQRGLNRSCPDDVHNAFYKGKLRFVDFEHDVDRVGLKPIFDKLPKLVGISNWRRTKAKNHYWVFKNNLGRIRLFTNGTVELWVRKPASDGKCMQLFSHAFTWTKLIDSISQVEDFQKTLMRKMHAVFDYGQRVPYMKVTAFQGSHKFTYVSGDKSHPTCGEFMFEYHAEVESARRLFDQMQSFFEQFSPKPSDVRSKLPSQDYSV
jgi:hypothetical protein